MSMCVWQLVQHFVIKCYINAELFIQQKSAITVAWPNNAVQAVQAAPENCTQGRFDAGEAYNSVSHKYPAAVT